MISDDLYLDAVRLSCGAGVASASLLRLTGIANSYGQAVEVIDRMESDGIVGPSGENPAPRIVNRRKAMQFQQPFDARQVEPASFPPPPVLADYHVRITDSEGKPTNDQQGGYLEFQLEILDPGPYQARKIPYRLNLFNKNQQTVEIAYRQLSALCWVTNVLNIQDSRQLHGIPFIANIGPQPENPQYAKVFNIKDINGNLPGKAAPAATAPATVAPPAWAPPAAAAPVQQPPAWAPPGAVMPPQPAAPPAWAPPMAVQAAQPPAWAPPGQAQPTAPAAPPWQPSGQPTAPPWAK